jgi:tetratricopeptide (TPR) repeat protein
MAIMALTEYFLVYLILFRLSIIGAGVISIVLGYRLFRVAYGPHSSRSGKNQQSAETSAGASIGGWSFSIKNAAPGTCFAIFGAIIIVVMFAQGGPQLTLKNLEMARDISASKDRTRIGELSMRGDEKAGLEASTRKGLFFEGENDIEGAIAAYEEALKYMAAPMNNLSWLYLKKGRVREALPIAAIAVQLSPNEANYLDTLAEIYYKSGNTAEAIVIMERAAQIDSKYRKRLEQFKETVK